MDGTKFQKLFDKTADNINTVVHGKDDVVRLALTAIMANGHVLFEDVPGVGKSVLARALGASMQAEMNRVQCTPDQVIEHPDVVASYLGTSPEVIQRSGGRK